MDNSIEQQGATAASLRVTPADIEAHIASEFGFNLGVAARNAGVPHSPELDRITLHSLVLKNGHVVVGQSAVADMAGFDQAKGIATARADAVRQVWPLLGYELRTQLKSQESVPQSLAHAPKSEPELTFNCPQRMSGAAGNNDHWRENNSCSYCGSLHPDEFMAAVESGAGALTATDKNYKVYIDMPNPRVGKPRIVSYTSGSADQPRSATAPWERATEEHVADARKQGIRSLAVNDWVQVVPERETEHRKFYFEHLSLDQRRRFIDLYNEKKVRFAHAGRFYRLPFFMIPAAPSADNVGASV